MSQETINLLVGALIGIVSSLLTVIIGNHFQDKREVRKRKWELENIEINRRIQAKDNRLREAQAYLDAYEEAIHVLGRVELDMMMSKPSEKYWADFDRAEKLIKFTAKRKVSISFLDDAQLKDLDKQLVSRFDVERKYAMDLEERVSEGQGQSQGHAFDVKDLFRTEFYDEMSMILGKMQERIEILIETIE